MKYEAPAWDDSDAGVFRVLASNGGVRLDREIAILFTMPIDEKLADHIRSGFPADVDFSERKMFGGLAFLVRGHMAIAASGKGGVLVRCGPDQFEKLATEAGVEVAVMRGREMKGWLRVPASKLRTKRQLQRWIDLSLAHVNTLPEK